MQSPVTTTAATRDLSLALLHLHLHHTDHPFTPTPLTATAPTPPTDLHLLLPSQQTSLLHTAMRLDQLHRPPRLSPRVSHLACLQLPRMDLHLLRTALDTCRATLQVCVD